jgi:hypothetical protein
MRTCEMNDVLAYITAVFSLVSSFLGFPKAVLDGLAALRKASSPILKNPKSIIPSSV